MDLIFHIGCEKTGTTSLQVWLDQHAESLRAQGIFYSAVLGRPNNRKISHYGLAPGTPDEGLRRDGIHDAAAHAALSKTIGAAVIAEVESAAALGCTTFVISNEYCHSRLKTAESVERVHALLAPLFDSMRVVCFLRPQIDLCLSLASTLTRNGGEINRVWIDQQMRPTNLYCDYDKLLRRWADRFGGGCIVPVSFRRNGDTVRWFEQILGVTDLRLPRRRAANAAVDFRVMQLVNAMHAANPAQADMEFGSRFFVNELAVEQRLTLDRMSAQSLQGRFAKSNAAVCAAWPQIEAADLRPDWRHYPEVGNIDEIDAALGIGPVLYQIIARMHAETVFQRAKVMAVMSERDVQRGKKDAALSACREGIALARQILHVEAHRNALEHLIANLELRISRIETAPEFQS